MSAIQNMVFLVGSPKAKDSTSESLGGYLRDQLIARGAQAQTFHAHKVLRTAKNTADFLEAVDHADLMLVAFPLYVDTLPYVLQHTLEHLAAHRQGALRSKSQRLVCISNSGFPEADHNALALEVCEQFAQEADFAWYGGIALGGGGVIGGQPLAELGVAHNLRAALDKAAAALLHDQPVPQAVIDTFAKPLIPKRMYTLVGTIGWHMQARQNGVFGQLNRRPFTEN